MSFWLIAFHTLSYLLAAIGLGGALLLLLQSMHAGPNRRILRTLAFTFLIWGLPALLTCILRDVQLWRTLEPMGVLSLLAGNLYIALCLLYPLELARPGWITARRIALLLLPYVLLTAFYFTVLALLHEQTRTLYSVTDLLLHAGEFNVWFRFVLYLLTCFYLAFLYLNTGVRAFELRNRFPDPAAPERRGLWRLHIYGIGMICITLVYLGVLLNGSLPSMVLHRMTTTLFFGILLFVTLFRPHSVPQSLPEA